MRLEKEELEYYAREKNIPFLSFKEQFKGYDLVFTEIPIKDLEVVRYQRKPSKAHVTNLAKSISRLGFVVPIVVAKKPGDKKFIILDGQHRFLACTELGISRIPAVVVPWELAIQMISLNVEKQPNIKEKSYVAVRVYREIVEENPEILESSDDVLSAVEEIYFVTCGIVYEKDEKFSAASWETILKKADWPLDMKIKEAMKKREERAEKLLSLHSKIKEIITKIKEMEKEGGIKISHPFIYKEIVSYANPAKRRKKVVAEYDEMMNQIEEKLEELYENPKLIIASIGEAEEFE